MPTSGKLGLWTGLAAFLALAIGMAVIGFPAQGQGVVVGLWVTEILAIALPAFFVLSLAGLRFGPYLGFRRLSWKRAAAAAGLAIANQPVVEFLTWAARSVLPPQAVAEFDLRQRMLDALFRANAIPMLITVTIAAPLGEELFFRGLLLPSLRRGLGTIASVIATAALFSAIHLDKVGFLGLMEIGILLGALRLWSGSLWAAVIGHAMNNGVAGAAFMLGLQDPNHQPQAWVLVLGAILLIAGIVLLPRALREDQAPPAEEVPGGPGKFAAVALAVPWLAGCVWGFPILREMVRAAGF